MSGLNATPNGMNSSPSWRRLTRFLVVTACVVVIGIGTAWTWRWTKYAPVRAAELAHVRLQHAEALELGTQFLWSHPNDPRASRVVALSLCTLGRPHEAERYFEAAGDCLDRDDFKRRVSGLILTRRSTRAVAVLREALRRWPDDAASLRTLAALCGELGRNDEAIELAQRLCRISSSEAVGYALLGSIHQRMGHVQETVDCYLKTLELDPQLTSVPDPRVLLRTLADGLYSLERLDESESYFRRDDGECGCREPARARFAAAREGRHRRRRTELARGDRSES